MGHLNQQNYGKLAQRLGQYVPGAFVSETLVEILKQLVSEEEALLCSMMPLRVVLAEKMAQVWDMSAEQSSAVGLTKGSRTNGVPGVNFENTDTEKA